MEREVIHPLSNIKIKIGLTICFGPCYFLNNSLILGAVAQLGERLNGIQEADGSIPFSSTIDFQGVDPFDVVQPFLVMFDSPLQKENDR